MVYRSLMNCGAMDWLSPSLPFLAALQKLNFLLAPAKFLSFLGNEEFFLLLLPFVYWAVDRKTGARLGALLLFSAALNDIIKVAFAWPRPYWLQPSLQRATEASFGFPSGHAQNAAVVWTFLAAQTRRPRVWIPLALLLIAAIAASRFVLGVHFPLDAIGGALIGFAILGLCARNEARWMEFWHEIKIYQKIGIAALLVLALSALYFMAIFSGLAGYQADQNGPSMPAVQSAMNGTGISSRLGALFGLIVGLSLASRLDFEAAAPLATKAARLLIGFVGLALFYVGLKRVFPDLLVFRFARYALTTGWVSFGAPWVFGKLGLARIRTKAM
jgi:membrane-associated phospholipid phosphatase